MGCSKQMKKQADVSEISEQMVFADQGSSKEAGAETFEQKNNSRTTQRNIGGGVL